MKYVIVSCDVSGFHLIDWSDRAIGAMKIAEANNAEVYGIEEYLWLMKYS